ncbi:MAG: hypothetical protein ACI8QS_001326 [Planctomycetota bacterium]|jgi:hypothetical protein
MLNLKRAPLLLSLSFFASCGTNAETDADHSGSTVAEEVGTDSNQEIELAEGEAHVECGCAIASIGACGEYIEVDGEMVELIFPDGVDLGPMPFCGKDDLVATVGGAMSGDDKYVATDFALRE